MTQYINKDAVVAEIKRLIKHSEMVADHNTQITELVSRELDALYHLISFLDTLETKEVDFDAAVHGRIDYPFIGHDFPNIYPNYKELKDYCDKNGIKDEDKVKIIIIKDDIL